MRDSYLLEKNKKITTIPLSQKIFFYIAVQKITNN